MRKNKALLMVLKVSMIVIIFFWLFRKIDFNEIQNSLKNISYFPMFIAFIIAFLNRLIMAYKWLILLRHHGTETKYFNALKIVFISQFLGAIIPSGLGVDAVRFLKIQKHNKNFSASFGSIFVDRVLAIFMMCLLCIGAIFFSWNLMEVKNLLIVVFILSLVILSGIILMMTSFPVWFFSFSKSFFSHKESKGIKNFIYIKLVYLGEKLLKIHDDFRKLLSDKNKFSKQCLLNFIAQFFRILQFHFIFLSLNYDINLAYEISVVPIIILITLLPISFSGLGVKEGAFVYFFSQIHVPVSISLCVSLLSYLLLFAGIIPGAVFFLLENKSSSANNK